MKPLTHQRTEQVEISREIAREPIDHDTKVCILTAVYSRPGSYVVRRDGNLWIKSGRFEVLASRLCPTRPNCCT